MEAAESWPPNWASSWPPSGHTVHFITYNQPVRLDILKENIYYHEVNVKDYPLFQYQPYELALSNKMVDTVFE